MKRLSRQADFSGRASYADANPKTTKSGQTQETPMSQEWQPLVPSFPDEENNAYDKAQNPQHHETDPQNHRKLFKEVTGKPNSQDCLPKIGNISGDKLPAGFIDRYHVKLSLAQISVDQDTCVNQAGHAVRRREVCSHARRSLRSYIILEVDAVTFVYDNTNSTYYGGSSHCPRLDRGVGFPLSRE